MTRRASRDDSGLTLIEAVIAMGILAVAVITLVGGLASLSLLSQEHRGHAVAETATRSFGQAVQALAQSSSPLADPVNSTSTPSFTVSDATTFPPPSTDASRYSYLLVDREVVRLTAVNRITGALTVVRGQGGTEAATHAADANVVPLLRCPHASTLTPVPATYTVTPGTVVSVDAVEYWSVTTSTFVNQATCLTQYNALCPSSTLLPECSAGLFRVTLKVTGPDDARPAGIDTAADGIDTTTSLLVRSGSP